MDSVNIDIPNSRALVKQILTLAQDVENQPFIAQGGRENAINVISS